MPADPYYYPHEVRGKSRKVFPAIFVAMILLAASVLGVLYVFPPEYDLFKPDEYVIYGSGAVLSGKIGIESDPLDTDPYDGTAGIILTSGPYSGTGYGWVITPVDFYVPPGLGNPYGLPPGSISEHGADLKSLTCVLKPGLYSVKLTVNGTSHTGKFALEGEVVREYGWKFNQVLEETMPDGTNSYVTHDFETEFRFLYGDTLSSVQYDGARGHFPFKNLDEVMTFFTSDSSKVTKELQTVLRGEFDEKNIPHSFIGTDQFHYASYLLAFVQQTVSYVEDGHLYGISEYWAFPAETIMRGQGDCEDTSFLCAALFKAAGFETAVGIFPGHAMAGVYLSEDTAEHRKYSLLPDGSDDYPIHQDIGNKRYYGCETAFYEYVQFPIGYTNIIFDGYIDEEHVVGELVTWLPGGENRKENRPFGFYVISDY